MEINFSIGGTSKNPTFLIEVSDMNLKDLSNLSEFLNDPSDILIGIASDTIMFISSKNIKALWRTHPATKYELMHISELGIFLLNKKAFQREISEDQDIDLSDMIKLEKREEDNE